MKKLFSDTLSEVRRNNNGEVFFITIMAEPCEGNDEFKEAGGAYVNCWVNADTLREAEISALNEIESENWKPKKIEEWEILCEECYENRDDLDQEEVEELKSCLSEAYEHGISLLFHCWPIGAEDDEECQ
jgi:hypothetical protein